MNFFRFFSLLILFIFNINSIFSNKEIKIATFYQEPYISKYSSEKGYIYELISEVFKKAGYDIDIIFLPLTRAKFLVEKGEIDAIMPVYYSKDSSLAFSEPFKGNTISILKKTSLSLPIDTEIESTLFDYLNAIKPYKIGVLNGLYTSTEFDSIDFLQKEYVSDDLQNFFKLESNRIDLIVIDKYTAANILSTDMPHLIGKVELLDQPITSNDFHIAFSKKVNGYQEKLADFNRILKQMKSDGSYSKFLEKRGIFEKTKDIKEKITLTVGSVNNEDMFIMKKLSKEYQKTHPNITFNWKFLEEETLRKRLLSDMAIQEGIFDIVTIGSFEAPIWSKNGWLLPFNNIPASYDIDDIFAPIKNELVYNNTFYALPFYGESSILYYRKDLFDKLGLIMPQKPTYEDIEKLAALLHNPQNNIYGIGLRGKAGWGANMALINTIVNTYGGHWFDMNWNPTINNSHWKTALAIYKSLITNYGPPDFSNNNYNELLTLFSEGNLAMWIDATVATGSLYNPSKSKVYDKVALAPAPIALTEKGAKWLWTWNLAVPYSSKHSKEAREFILWATSKEYINLAGKSEGWLSIPQGTRISTYKNPAYLKAAPFAPYIFRTINSIDINQNTLVKSPYKGIQYVNIPEYPSLGLKLGLYIDKMLIGEMTIKEVLEKAQEEVNQQMKRSGYIN